jgi:hypothetical protein
VRPTESINIAISVGTYSLLLFTAMPILGISWSLIVTRYSRIRASPVSTSRKPQNPVGKREYTPIVVGDPATLGDLVVLLGSLFG